MKTLVMIATLIGSLSAQASGTSVTALVSCKKTDAVTRLEVAIVQDFADRPGLTALVIGYNPRTSSPFLISQTPVIEKARGQAVAYHGVDQSVYLSFTRIKMKGQAEVKQYGRLAYKADDMGCEYDTKVQF